MTSKNNPAPVVSDLTLSPAANSPAPMPSKPLLPSRPLATQQYLYFTETNTDRILDNLDGLRDMVFPRPSHLEGDNEQHNDQEFPSVCLIGLGRCGSNIALDVAELVYNARKFYLNEFNNEDRLSPDKRFAIEPLPLPRMREGWVIGCAVKKDNTDLARALQVAINELSRNGRLAAMFAAANVTWRQP